MYIGYDSIVTLLKSNSQQTKKGKQQENVSIKVIEREKEVLTQNENHFNT